MDPLNRLLHIEIVTTVWLIVNLDSVILMLLHRLYIKCTHGGTNRLAMDDIHDAS